MNERRKKDNMKFLSHNHAATDRTQQAGTSPLWHRAAPLLLASVLLTMSLCSFTVPANAAATDIVPASTAEAPTLLTAAATGAETRTIFSPAARTTTRITYPYPWGAMAVDLYVNGRRTLRGEVAEIGGTVYVPVQRYADLFGSFRTTYTEATETVVITGQNLSIRVRVGDPYITVNERIFYTGKAVLSLGGWIFVPIESMTRAMGGRVSIRRGYYEAYVTAGDPTRIAWADDYYNANDLYWLSRIISAESRGEPFRGQIAVGNVVLNRVRHQSYPNTVKGVVFDRKYGTQFAPVANGTIYNEPTPSAIMAAKICLEGYSLSDSMIYFFNPATTTSTWIRDNRPYVMTIGHHTFYG